MESDSGNSTSVRCRQCGRAVPAFDESEPASDRTAARVGKTYQVAVACASCGTPFVVLARN